MLSEEIKEFLHKEALDRFLRYVQLWTTSDEHSQSNPSTQNQLDLGKILASELMELNLEDVTHDEFGYVYGNLSASNGLEKNSSYGYFTGG
ncbi:MAG: hypothetical protein ACTSQW_09205 [Promethearchaeota archaeon]